MAWAQSDYTVTPSVKVTELYDDNVFDTPSRSQPNGSPSSQGDEKRDDFITRGTAGLDVGYRTRPFTLHLGYDLSGENYADNSRESDFPSSQHGRVEASFVESRRLSFTLNGSYQESNRSRDLNTPFARAIEPDVVGAPPSLGTTALNTGRSRSEIYQGGGAAGYRLDPITELRTGFSYAHTQQVGASSNDDYLADLDGSRKLTEKLDGEIHYAYRHFSFGSDSLNPSDRSSDSHSVTAGGSYRYSPRVSFMLLAGPRFTEGSVDSEVIAEITYLLERGLVDLHYQRTLTTSVGGGDTVDSNEVTLSASYRAAEDLTATLALSYNHESTGGTSANIYRSVVSVSYAITRWLSIVGSYEFSDQDATFNSSEQGGSIRHNIVQIGVAAEQAFQVL